MMNLKEITEENVKVIDTLLQSPRINLAARSSRPNSNGQTALHLLARQCGPKLRPRDKVSNKWNPLRRVKVFLKEAKRRNIDVINMQDSMSQTFVHEAFWVRNFWTMKKRYNSASIENHNCIANLNFCARKHNEHNLY